MAYVIGITSTVVWQSSWGTAATSSQVDSFMKIPNPITGKKYASISAGQPYQIAIIAYGKSSNAIVHFGKWTGTNKCTAKWGRLERFVHGSYSPYRNTSQSYGGIVRVYHVE